MLLQRRVAALERTPVLRLRGVELARLPQRLSVPLIALDGALNDGKVAGPGLDQRVEFTGALLGHLQGSRRVAGGAFDVRQLEVGDRALTAERRVIHFHGEA